MGKQGPVARSSVKDLLPAAILWVLMLGVWMLLSGSLVLSELVAGIAAAAIAAVAFEAVRRQGLVRFRPRARWVLRAWRLPGRLFRESAVVSWALLKGLALRRPVRGRFREVPLRAGGRDGRSQARRILITAAASLSPNAYVVDVDTENDTLLIHELVPGSGRSPIP
jgi:multisubunit Na+/H+ antiporter MnhE subunit